MHILKPKQIRLNEKESEEILSKLNVSKSQFPKILLSDTGLPPNSQVGDIIKIERIYNGKTKLYYRVVV